jgi:hypothetical protein
MEALILASMVSCADGAWILSGLVDSEVSDLIKSEVRTEIIQVMPDDCLNEQYNPTGRK